jgi:hypothetical protein
VIKPETDIDTRQVIAGRQQAKASNVLRPSLSTTLEWVLRQYEQEENRLADAGIESLPQLSDVLAQVYAKTGRSAGTDGILVWIL